MGGSFFNYPAVSFNKKKQGKIKVENGRANIIPDGFQVSMIAPKKQMLGWCGVSYTYMSHFQIWV